MVQLSSYGTVQSLVSLVTRSRQQYVNRTLRISSCSNTVSKDHLPRVTTFDIFLADTSHLYVPQKERASFEPNSATSLVTSRNSEAPIAPNNSRITNVSTTTM